VSTTIRRAGIGVAIVTASVFAFTPAAHAQPLDAPPAAVTVANVAPVAHTQSVATGQNTAVPITLDGDDPDVGDSITYAVVTAPTHGTLEGPSEAALRKYTPTTGFTGIDSFTFKVTDSHGASSTATVTITVLPAQPVNRPPVAGNQSVTTPLNTPIGITLQGTDPDNDGITYLLGAKPAHGTLTGSAPNVIYTPDTGFTGVDSFTFKVDDNKLQSAKGTVTITVAKPNTAPLAKNIVATTIQNHSVGVTLQGSDPDGDAITYSFTSPSHGTVTGTAPNLTYTPAKWFHGTDSFTYTVSDGKLTSAPATVTIVVRGFKHRPIAYDQSVTTGVKQPVKIHLNGWTRDGDDLDFIIVDRADHGRLIQHGDDVVYIPSRHFKGYDEFRFVVRDEDGTTSRPATVSIKVKPSWGGYHQNW